MKKSILTPVIPEIMKDLKTIYFNVVQADSLNPFTINGKRNLNYHYFQLTDQGWFFHWITEETDVTWLKEKIEEQEIYIFNN